MGSRSRSLAGPLLPEWAGAGADPDRGRYAGLPGTAYAKILREPWTGVAPSGAYWNPTVIESDTRLAALGLRHHRLRVRGPTGRPPSRSSVTLLYRRAFLELAEQKGWDLADIVMAEEDITSGWPLRERRTLMAHQRRPGGWFRYGRS